MESRKQHQETMAAMGHIRDEFIGLRSFLETKNPQLMEKALANALEAWSFDSSHASQSQQSQPNVTGDQQTK